jgi:hypothetical protein
MKQQIECQTISDKMSGGVQNKMSDGMLEENAR